jgi:hypothetical protein
MEFNPATKAQIAQIQGIEIIKKVINIVQYYYTSDKHMNKLQRMFDIANEKDTE